MWAGLVTCFSLIKYDKGNRISLPWLHYVTQDSILLSDLLWRLSLLAGWSRRLCWKSPHGSELQAGPKSRRRPQHTASEVPLSWRWKEVNSANNLSKLTSRFLPIPASRWKGSPADMWITALWDPKQRMWLCHAWTLGTLKLWNNKNVLF